MEQPKKPAGGGFGVFVAEKRPEFQQACAGQPVTAVTKMAGEQWKKLSEAEQAPYKQKYEANKAKYETDMAAFLAGGGEKAKGAAALRTEKRKAKEGKKTKDPDQPKKPAGGAFGVFLEENRSKIVASLPAGHKITDVSKAAGVQWKALSEGDRKPYDDKYLVKKEAYTKAMEAYKASNAGAADDSADGEEPPETASPKTASSKKASPQKRAAEADKRATPAKAGRKSKSSEPEAPTVDAVLLKEAEALKLEGPLKNLLARPDIVAKGVSQKQMLEALKKHGGLVNKAKAALLGA